MKIHVLLSFFYLLLSCSTDKKTENEQQKSEETVKTYKIVWSDDFDVAGKPDANKWGYEYGLIRNEEAQYYTDSLKNARVGEGNLIIETFKEQIKNASFSSASLTTKDIAEWTYGKIEVKAKLPKGRGMWPAIWMLGKNEEKVGWPKCGEIDIMEHVGFNKDSIFGTVHTEAFNHTKGTEVGKSIFIKEPYDEFHIYAVQWTPEKIDFLLDGEVYHQFKNQNKTSDEWPFDQPFYLKLNVAVGGAWGGQQGIDETIFPQQMVVNYVRVYQLK